MIASARRRSLAVAGLALLAGTLLACGGDAGGGDDRQAPRPALEGAATGPVPTAGRTPIAAERVYDIPVRASATRGPADARVTIVEFADYQCPFCAQSAPLMRQVLQAYAHDVRLVYKQFPLTGIHRNAMAASRAAVAAGKQGRFWEMHDLLYQHSRDLTPERLEALAQQIGLDVARWRRDLDADDVAAAIEQDRADGRAAEVTGTPMIFVNGRRLGTRSFDALKAMIEPELRG